SCDVPFLVPAFVCRLIDLLADYPICVPQVDGWHHPLAAVYRLEVLDAVRRLLAENRLRPVFLFEKGATCVLTKADLTHSYPTLQSLNNLNTPKKHQAAVSKIIKN